MSKQFVLDKIPHFVDAKVSLCGEDYDLKMVKENGCVITVTQDGLVRDQISLTKNGMRAFHLLLSAKE